MTNNTSRQYGEARCWHSWGVKTISNATSATLLLEITRQVSDFNIQYFIGRKYLKYSRYSRRCALRLPLKASTLNPRSFQNLKNISKGPSRCLSSWTCPFLLRVRVGNKNIEEPKKQNISLFNDLHDHRIYSRNATYPFLKNRSWQSLIDQRRPSGELGPKLSQIHISIRLIQQVWNTYMA